jgi:hopene-associated glycosyltransferase HpnB
MDLSNALLGLTCLSLLAWLYLLIGRSGFWRARPRIEEERAIAPAAWPAVVAIVPARNEGEHVAAALRSLLAQDYPGRLVILLVDDGSEDRTRAIAGRLKDEAPAARRLEVLAARPLPPGWTGKLWAMAEGLARAGRMAPDAPYLLLTDADIAHARDGLARLVAKAEADRLDLVSLMVRLRCETSWERLLIPPFVLFFRMLYPFLAVNDPKRSPAAAAGGCMLVRRSALDGAGGLEAVRGALIDDVALARAIKHRPGGGRIWLGLTSRTRSLRSYATLAEIWAMVARTADTQLRHSLLLLAGAMVGMALAYLLPPLAILGLPLHRDLAVASVGVLAWVAMSEAYLPTVRLYGLPRIWTATLPAAAALYMAMSVDSAIRHRRGVGSSWKGREYPLER